jgi:hypothetical protein
MEPFMPRLTGIAPEFLVADVVKAAEHYRDRLGFTIIGYFFGDPPVFAMVGRDDKIIMLSLVENGRGGSNRNFKPEAIDPICGWTTSTRFTPSFNAAASRSSCRRPCASTA